MGQKDRVFPVIDKCIESGCLKIIEGVRECIAFSDPQLQWANGKTCYGLVTRIEDLKRISADMENYSKHTSSNSIGLRHFIRRKEKQLDSNTSRKVG